MLYGDSEERSFLGRVIGLPNESVRAEDGRLIVDDEVVEEPWLPDDVVTPDFGPEELGAGEYFVHGDWRTNAVPTLVAASDVLGLVECGDSKIDC
jgi:signal peptidase I